MISLFGKKENDNKLVTEFNTTELSNEKIRLLKAFMTEIDLTINSDCESRFFNHSAELMRLCAAVIQSSKFVEMHQEGSEIPFHDQAIEYSIDILQEYLNENKVKHYDN